MTDPTTQTSDQSGAASDPKALVGISISESPDLARLGFGEEHLQELMGSVARAVLRLPQLEISLVYGGDLRPGGFTRFLFDIVSSERAGPTDERSEPPRRLFNYLAWPYYLTLAKADEAQMINVCHFMRITPTTAGFAQVPENRPSGEQRDPPAALVSSRCLTRMRRLATDGGHPDFEDRSAPPLRARILIGGKTTGYSSFMPGLFEEFLIAREPGANGRPPLPVYVIGALGGAAGQLAAALLDPRATKPLTLDHQRDRYRATGVDRLEVLLDIYKQNGKLPQPEDRYTALHDRIQELSAVIRGDHEDALGNGLTPEENQALLQTRDEVEIRRLIQKGLGAVCARNP